MDQIRTANENTTESAFDGGETGAGSRELRLLNDLEMVCVGGGDGGVKWP